MTGSITLVRELIALGLVDEYRLFIYPVVLRRGARLFEGATNLPKLKLVDSPPLPLRGRAHELQHGRDDERAPRAIQRPSAVVGRPSTGHGQIGLQLQTATYVAEIRQTLRRRPPNTSCERRVNSVSRRAAAAPRRLPRDEGWGAGANAAHQRGLGGEVLLARLDHLLGFVELLQEVELDLFLERVAA